MEDEIFDVVDERDEVVGRATRRDVHARGLKHRAVHVLAFDAAGRVFLQRRSRTKDVAPGLWDSSCSGHLAAGEDYDACAVRELGEELGLERDIRPVRWFRVEACPETGWEFVWAYRLNHGGPFALNAAEIEGGEWLAPRDVSRAIAGRPDAFSGAFRHVWSRIPPG